MKFETHLGMSPLQRKLRRVLSSRTISFTHLENTGSHCPSVLKIQTSNDNITNKETCWSSDLLLFLLQHIHHLQLSKLAPISDMTIIGINLAALTHQAWMVNYSSLKSWRKNVANPWTEISTCFSCSSPPHLPLLSF